MTFLTIEQSRRVDEIAINEYGISGLTLMENAGRACADWLMDGPPGRVIIGCGCGNNGGDGLVIARLLIKQNVDVQVLVLGNLERMSPDTSVNLGRLQEMNVEITQIQSDWTATVAGRKTRDFFALDGEESWFVDAFLGTGAKGVPRPPLDRIIAWVNQLPIKRLAVDLPSGSDADTGEASESKVEAHVTCTLVAQKVGFQNPNAKRFLGEVHVMDIGVPQSVVEKVLQG